MVTTTKFTRRDYMVLPEGYPAELVRGMLVKTPSPSWRHQQVVGRLYVLLCGACDPARVFLSPIDVFLGDEDVLRPDLCVLRAPLLRSAPDIGVPVAVFEVLSPSTEDRDRREKTAIYLEGGVEEVFLIDPRTSTVERITPARTTLYGVGAKVECTAVSGLALAPESIFAEHESPDR